MSVKSEPVAPALAAVNRPPAAPAADGLPCGPVSRAWTARFTLAWLGFWMANLVPLQLLIPEQLASIDPASKVRDLALVNGISGLVALVTLPVCGVLSDRSRSRWGRRRVWIATGAALFASGLVLTGLQTSWGTLAACWSFTMIGLSATMAGLTAVIADRVPDRQRGMISGAIYGPQALGVVIGIAVLSIFGLSSRQGYIVIAALLPALSAPFVRRYREVPAEATENLTASAILGSMRIDARANPDFAWAFGGRLLVNLANSLGTCYLLYFLTDDLKVRHPDAALLELTIVYLFFGLVTTYAGGTLSDRVGRRRIFALATAAMQAFAGFQLACFPSFTVTLSAAAFMGGGFGAYMSVDQALVTHVLPDAQSRAKDLGIMNIGAIVPPALAPLIAGTIIASAGGYPILFALVGLIATTGALMVYRVRSVR